MRVATDTRLLEVEPGSTADVVVEIVNTESVIDGMTARVIGLPDEAVSSHPKLLPLFPEASGQMTLSLTVPQTQPAGRHPLTVEVSSHGARLAPAYVDVDIDVSARPGLAMAVEPHVIRARRSARFVLEMHNSGNVPLSVRMRALDPDRAISAEFSPDVLRLEPGARAPVLLHVRGPRMFTGAEVDRSVTVEATAMRAEALAGPPAEPEIEPDGVATQSTVVRLRQRPTISRGLLTVLILAAIVGLWALVFLLGIAKVFAGDPMTKQAPASFFAVAANAGASTAPGAAGASGKAAKPPPGALPKTGQVPPGVGGEITGTVTAASDHEPVGRILVRAYRQTRDGPKLVSSAATQADGTYALAGLFPTSYYIEFSASGFDPVWYPNAHAMSGGENVSTAAQGTTKNVNAVITGKVASISGQINPGDTLKAVITTVTARPLDGASGAVAPASTTGPIAATTKTDASGKYTLKNLPAPGTYQLSFTAPGYQVTTIVDSVGGGEQRLEPTVRLGATVGQISGTVLGDDAPLGGASVRTTVGGKALTVKTPTTGTVGAFSLVNLPTPATYVITFSAPGYGTQTTIIDLKAGQSHGNLTAKLARGTGSVTGTVTGPDGKGLGGVTVTVGGTSTTSGGKAPTTTTLTKGAVGTYVINGLRAPGAYTLTFSKDGYAPASVPVTLSGNGAPPVADARLSSDVGTISGTVTGSACAGATITARNGQPGTAWTGTASSSGCQYEIAGLPPGTYSVTATADAHKQQTAIVTVSAGKTTTVPDLTVAD